MAANTDILTVCRSEGTALIREELRSSAQRKRLEAAAIDAIRKAGCTVDEVSDATGLTPRDIDRLLNAPREWEDDLAALAGLPA